MVISISVSRSEHGGSEDRDVQSHTNAQSGMLRTPEIYNDRKINMWLMIFQGCECRECKYWSQTQRCCNVRSAKAHFLF